MRVGIKALDINREDFGGGERYLHFLLQHLVEIDQENEYFISATPQNQNRFTVNQKNLKTIICPVHINNKIKGILYGQFILREHLKEGDSRGLTKNITILECGL